MFYEAIETYCCQRGRMMGLELFQDMLIKLFWKHEKKHEKTRENILQNEKENKQDKTK